MNALPTVLLRHETSGGDHYDWLLTNPHDPQGLLWTARTDLPSDQWAIQRTWPLEPIAPHRRLYLTYEGPLSDNRGSVTRIDEGTFIPLEWSPDRILIDLTLRHCQGRVLLEQLDPHHWRACLQTSI